MEYIKKYSSIYPDIKLQGIHSEYFKKDGITLDPQSVIWRQIVIGCDKNSISPTLAEFGQEYTVPSLPLSKISESIKFEIIQMMGLKTNDFGYSKFY